MKRRRMVGLAVVALALAGLVSVGAYRLLRAGATRVVAAPTVAVVAAAGALTAGTKIGPGDLKLVNLPKASLPAHVFAATDKLVGRVLTTAAVANQVVVGEMVAAEGSGVGLPPLIPSGMRAVSVKVNDVVSVAGYALPGTHVDVLLTGNPTRDNNPRSVTTVTLLTNVQVLTAGQQLERRADGKPENVTVITLLVDPAGAEKLALADGYGRIQLALRNPLDREATKVQPLLNGSLYASRTTSRVVRRVAKAPAPIVAPEWAVEVIRGGEHQVLKFPAVAAGPAVAMDTQKGDHQ